jgi:hypothetical protein
VKRLYPRIALFVALAPAPLCAQVIRGSLIRADGVTPAEGVVIVAHSPTADSVLGRALSNGAGRFTLALRPGEVTLRALRIGQMPYHLGAFTLAPGDTQDIRVVLPHTPIVLPTVTTTARSACRLSGSAGAAVAATFEEARKAILSTTLSASEGPPVASYSTFTQERTVGNRDLSPKKREFFEGPSQSPFATLSPEALAENGYKISGQRETSYWAPDANVLLSDVFVEGHCLGLVEGKDARAEWTGLTFRPARVRRGVVEVSGTLWLDRATSELRRLEFRYEGLPAYLARLQLGGDMELTRLAEGSWFISAWEIRMPRMTFADQLGGRVSGLHVAGGDVWRMHRGDDVLFSNGLEVPNRAKALGSTVAVQLPSAAPAAVNADTLILESECDEKAANGQGRLYGVVHDEAGRPLMDAMIRVEWQVGHFSDGRQLRWLSQMLSAMSARDGSFALCGVPREWVMHVQGQFGSQFTVRTVVRLAKDQARARVDLRLAGVDRAHTGVKIRVRDIADRPIPYAFVEVEGGKGRVADDGGWVVVASAPDSLRLSVRRIGYTPFDGKVGRGASGDFEVWLGPLAQQLGAVKVTANREAPMLAVTGFYDRMLRTQRGAFNGEFVTPEELETRPNLRATDVLYGRRFILMTRDDRGRAFAVGRAGCTMSVFLDGVQLLRDSVVAGGRSMYVTLIDEVVNLSAVAGIEMYASASSAPPELQPAVGSAEMASCGIIALWTGSRH